MARCKMTRVEPVVQCTKETHKLSEACEYAARKDDDNLSPAVAAVLREAGEQGWSVADGNVLHRPSREGDDATIAAAIVYAVNHAQGWLDEVATLTVDVTRERDIAIAMDVKLYRTVTALRDAEAEVGRLQEALDVQVSKEAWATQAEALRVAEAALESVAIIKSFGLCWCGSAGGIHEHDPECLQAAKALATIRALNPNNKE